MLGTFAILQWSKEASFYLLPGQNYKNRKHMVSWNKQHLFSLTTAFYNNDVMALCLLKLHHILYAWVLFPWVKNSLSLFKGDCINSRKCLSNIMKEKHIQMQTLGIKGKFGMLKSWKYMYHHWLLFTVPRIGYQLQLCCTCQVITTVSYTFCCKKKSLLIAIKGIEEKLQIISPNL